MVLWQAVVALRNPSSYIHQDFCWAPSCDTSIHAYLVSKQASVTGLPHLSVEPKSRVNILSLARKDVASGILTSDSGGLG